MRHSPLTCGFAILPLRAIPLGCALPRHARVTAVGYDCSAGEPAVLLPWARKALEQRGFSECRTGLNESRAQAFQTCFPR